jgi:hypothetical protein
MKFLIKRGPNCEEAKVSATIVIEKAILVTVIIDAAIVPNSERIADTFVLYTKGKCCLIENNDEASIQIVKMVMSMVLKTIAVGINQKLALIVSNNG